MQLKLALPKGHLLRSTEVLLRKAGLGLSDYNEQSRSYRPKCSGLPNLLIKVFHERDIPIQVAVGNYDLGICGLDWVEELLAKYPSSALIKIQNLEYGKRDLYVAQGKLRGISSLEELKSKGQTIRIVSEYPGLAESFALKCRLKRFKIFPVWGAAEVYPPESAELALISQPPLNAPPDQGLDLLATILESSAFLIANRNSWESKDLAALVQPLYAVRGIAEEDFATKELEVKKGGLSFGEQTLTPDLVRLALPDGHQQQPTLEFLNEAGFKIWGYSSQYRRPTVAVNGVATKVIRPQDMPLQVANENFDLAITGKDWLCDHLYRFPSSPVREVLDLGFGRVRIVAVVSKELGVDSAQDLREQLRGRAIRIASEYINIADKYARDNHFSPYRVIPTWGASEAFLPEDADVLIENTQTGRTLARHKLKIIDTLFESSACLIGNKNSGAGPIKERKIASIIEILQQAKAEGWEGHAC